MSDPKVRSIGLLATQKLCGTLSVESDAAVITSSLDMVKLICEEVPFKLNANKIAGALEIGRDTVVAYLKYLGDTKVLNLLYSGKKLIGKLAKPDKVYMENANLLYAPAL